MGRGESVQADEQDEYKEQVVRTRLTLIVCVAVFIVSFVLLFCGDGLGSLAFSVVGTFMAVGERMRVIELENEELRRDVDQLFEDEGEST